MCRPPRSTYGRATALGTGTVLGALAAATGSAFTIDAGIAVSIKLDDSGEIHGSITETPDAGAHLVERCVELAIEAFGDGESGTVETESDLPMATGLKSSSVAANAMVLATLSALGRSVDPDLDTDISRLDAYQMSVRATREVGVTATRAFDDAAASMVGGVVVTNNTEDGLIARDEVDWDVFVWTPPKRAYSADADVNRYENVAPTTDLVADLALEGRYAETMTVNGLAFSAALDFSTDPAIEAMPIADGVLLSGTGPNIVAVDDRIDLERVKELWDTREEEIRLTTTRTDGTRIR